MFAVFVDTALLPEVTEMAIGGGDISFLTVGVIALVD